MMAMPASAFHDRQLEALRKRTSLFTKRPSHDADEKFHDLHRAVEGIASDRREPRVTDIRWTITWAVMAAGITSSGKGVSTHGR
jgi:hypothetical protein